MTILTRPAPPPFLTLFALLGGAFAWTLHFLMSYWLLEYSCFIGSTWPILAVTVVMLVVAVVAGLAAYRAFRATRQTDEEEGTLPASRQRFLGFVSLVLNGIFLYAIVIETLPVFALGVC